MADPQITVGRSYRIDRPGMPQLEGKVVLNELDAPTLPHLWMELSQYPAAQNPALVAIGPGMILIPLP